IQRYKETKCVDDLPDRDSKQCTTKREDKEIFRLFSRNPTFCLRKGQAFLVKRT
ncbi:hypothetical protein WH47_09451, partial [Habropoda laboriosa]